MVDICLDLPADVLRVYERRAAACGRSAEDLIRNVIERSFPAFEGEVFDHEGLNDEPIVKAAEIEKVYRRLGYSLGWRFVTCPQDNTTAAKLLLITLNPGERSIDGPAWSQERGSAYHVEAWNGFPVGEAPLQRQVKQMIALLDLTEREVFSAYYVPFRSPNWNSLDRRAEAEAFAKSLWQWFIPSLHFERIVCMGKDRPGKAMARLFNAAFEGSHSDGARLLPIGIAFRTGAHLSLCPISADFGYLVVRRPRRR